MAWGRRILTLQGCPTIVLVMYTWQAFQPPPPRSARWCRDLKCCCCCCCWSSQLHVSARSWCLSTCPGLHPSHCAKCSKSHPPHSLLSGKVARFWQKHVFKQHVNNLMAQSSWNLHQRIEPAGSLDWIGFCEKNMILLTGQGAALAPFKRHWRVPESKVFDPIGNCGASGQGGPDTSRLCHTNVLLWL